MFSASLSIDQAILLRQILVWSWWLLPLAYAASAAAVLSRGSATCKRRMVWYGLLLAGLFAIQVVWNSTVFAFAPHGQSGWERAFLSVGKCIFAPDTFCPWPSAQFPTALACYAVLAAIVVTCARSRRKGSGGT
jgi:hypothetical protein